MTTTKRIKLDFSRALNPVIVWAKQGDVKSRFVEIEPYSDGVPMTIPSGVTGRFSCKKPDGKEVFNDKVTVASALVTVELSEQTLAVAGEAFCEVSLYQGNSILSTQGFILKIEPSAAPSAQIESDNDYGSYKAALIEIEAYKKEAEATVEAAQKALETSENALKIANNAVETFGNIQIVQEKGDNEGAVMSQKAVTAAFSMTDSSILKNSKRISNLEAAIAEQNIITTVDDSTALIKYPPENVLPYAAVNEVGGMTRKDETLGELKSAKVIRVNSSLAVINTWQKLQRVISEGKAQYYFAVGDQIKANGIGYWDVLDFDAHKIKSLGVVPTVTLGGHDIFAYGTIPFCASQLMYYTIGGLPAGKYKFTLDHARYGNGTEYDGTYMFTTTKDIPATGGFRHTNPIGGWKEKYAQSDVIGNYITTYGASPLHEEIEKGLSVSIWDGSACADLGTFTSQSATYYVEDDETNNGKRNLTERQAYGSNRWRDCVYRQWLNSDAPAVPSSDTTTISNWWTPKSVFDRIPGGAKLAGFLHGFDPVFINAMREVEVITSLCDCDKTETENYDITYDKVWLQSRTEVFGQTNNGVKEGKQFVYWVGTENSDRIKYQGNTARNWWLRSPSSNNTNFAYNVNTLGAFNSSNANAAHGVAPACCIVGGLSEGNDEFVFIPKDSSTTKNLHNIAIPEAVQALDGYGWGVSDTVYNYVDWENGTFVKKVHKITFNESSEFYEIESNDTYKKYVISLPFAPKPEYCLATLSGEYSASSGEFNYYIGDQFNVWTAKYTNAEDFNAYVAENPITLVYELAEPIITDISDILSPDNLLEVYEGGTVEVVTDDEYAESVPTKITFQSKNELFTN